MITFGCAGACKRRATAFSAFLLCVTCLRENCYQQAAAFFPVLRRCSHPSRLLKPSRRASHPAACPAVSRHTMGNPQEEATQYKNQGNDAFRNQAWDAALEFYTKAIETYNRDPSFYTNRAQVRASPVAHDCIPNSTSDIHQARTVRVRDTRCRHGDRARSEQCQGKIYPV